MTTQKFLLCLLLLLCFENVDAQEVANKTAKKFRFHSINQLGFVKGESETSFLFQSVNGVAYKTWFAGIGAGIDDYSRHSIPLFLDVRKRLKNSPNSFFVYADGGVNLPFKRKMENEFGIVKETKAGLYYDAGFGYHFQLQKDAALVINFGYTQKNMTQDEKGAPFIFDDEPRFITHHEYEFKRLSFKIGFVF